MKDKETKKKTTLKINEKQKNHKAH